MGGREEEVMAEKDRREEMLRDAERLVALLREGQDGYLSWHMSVDETMRSLVKNYYSRAESPACSV